MESGRARATDRGSGGLGLAEAGGCRLLLPGPGGRAGQPPLGCVATLLLAVAVVDAVGLLAVLDGDGCAGPHHRPIS